MSAPNDLSVNTQNIGILRQALALLLSERGMTMEDWAKDFGPYFTHEKRAQ